jgi:hypothetical protein
MLINCNISNAAGPVMLKGLERSNRFSVPANMRYILGSIVFAVITARIRFNHATNEELYFVTNDERRRILRKYKPDTQSNGSAGQGALFRLLGEGGSTPSSIKRAVKINVRSVLTPQL